MNPKNLTLVDEARHWWRLWSIRFNLLIAFGVSAVMSNPDILRVPLAYVPDFWRPAGVALVGILIAALPSAARLLKQRLPDGQ